VGVLRVVVALVGRVERRLAGAVGQDVGGRKGSRQCVFEHVRVAATSTIGSFTEACLDYMYLRSVAGGAAVPPHRAHDGLPHAHLMTGLGGATGR
jgi:hypothetical protein